MSGTNLFNRGTLLQEAVRSNYQDFVLILLEYGFDRFHICQNDRFYHFRVDPTSVGVDRVEPRTPLEIALENDQHLEVLRILAKFMEMPVNVRHTQLALLANNNEAYEAANEEFHKILNSLPLELVGNSVKASSLIFGWAGEHQQATARWIWDNSTRCCGNGQS